MNNLSKLSGVVVLAAAVSFLSGCESNGELGAGGGGGGGGGVTTRTLIVAVNGNGSVQSDTGDILCTSAGGDACTEAYDDGTTVTLTATAGAGSVFTAWAGNCTPVSGNPSQCTVTLNANETVLALFDTPVVGGVGDTVILTKSGTTSKLLTFNIAAPGAILSTSAIALANGTPLPEGDEIVAIARRPSNGVLYGLAQTSDETIGRLYVLNQGTGAATQVAQISGGGFAMVGPEFGMHFDDGTVFDRFVDSQANDVDRLRITDGATIYDVDAGNGSVLAVDTRALDSTVTALAGTNAFVGTHARTLYAIGGSTLSTLTLPAGLTTVGTLASAIPAANGFDINPINGTAYVAYTTASGPELLTVDLDLATLGTAQAIGDAAIDGESVRGLALAYPREPQVFGICGGVASPETNPEPPTCTPGKTLIRFNASNPSVYSTLPDVTGTATATETVIALDVRPSDNVLFALTSDPEADPSTFATGRLYTLNPVTSLLTPVSTLSEKLTKDRIYGFDFDPVTEQVRIIGGEADGDAAEVDNFVVTVATGAVEKEDAPRLQPFDITSAAFSNNNAGATGTTWYGIDSTSDRLFTIDRNTTPDEDPLTNPGRITLVGELSFDASPVGGFEIISTTGAPAPPLGVGWATRSDGANSYLNKIVLTTGASTAVGGAIGSLSGFSGPVIGLTATVNAGATTEMFVASTNAAPDARLLGFEGGDPGTGEDPVPETLTTNRLITGMTAGETVLAMDFRFANNSNTLYVLAKGVDSGTGSRARLYTVSISTGVASPVPPLPNPVTGAAAGDITVGGTPYILKGTHYGLDADPTRTDPLQAGTALRIVSDADENLAVNPTTGVASENVELNQTPLPVINALAFINNFDEATSSELLLLDTNVNADRVARLDTAQVISRSGPSGMDNGSGDETSWDILGGHNGISLVTEATCPLDNPTCATPPTPGYSSLYYLNPSTDTVTFIGELGVDDRTVGDPDTRIYLNAMTVRFPD